MEPSRVYRIVQVPCGKWTRVLQQDQAQTRRKPPLDGHHQNTTLSSHHKKTEADPYCKATQSSQNHKSTLASKHRKTILADPLHQPTRAGSHCQTKKTFCASSCSGLRVQWCWLYLALLMTLGRTSLSERTSWVYQSHTPFSIQKDFEKFVEEAGGNSRRFRFFGNFFNSDEHEAGNGKFLENSFLETPFQNDESVRKPFKQDFTSTIPIKPFVQDFPSRTPIKQFVEDIPPAKSPNKQILHEPPVVSRVPKSFFDDIFDHSLPLDSPYRTTFSFSSNPKSITSREENNKERTSRKLERHEKSFLSKSYQPFSSDLLTPLPFQKHTNIEGFTSQSLGNIKFSQQQSKSAFDNVSQFSGFSDKDLGSFSDEIRSTENEVSRIGFLLQRRPFFDRPRRPPRKLFLGKHKPEFMEENDSSFNSVDHSQNKPSTPSSQQKPTSSSEHEPPPSSPHRPPSPSSHAESHFGRPNFEAIVSGYEANENVHFGGSEDVSDPMAHGTLKRPHSGGSREKAVRVLRPNPFSAEGEGSLAAAGCPSEADGILYGAGAVWFGRGCQRHTCVHFRGRYFAETDTCDSEIHNTSYRCQVLVDSKASYPDCCPTYQCLSENLGRSSQDEDTEF